MATAAELSGNPADIHTSVRAHADLALSFWRFIQEDSSFHTIGDTKLIHNPVQIARADSQLLKILLCDYRSDDGSVQPEFRRVQRSRQCLVLRKGFFIKGLVDDIRRICALRNQASSNPHSLFFRVGMF